MTRFINYLINFPVYVKETGDPKIISKYEHAQTFVGRASDGIGNLGRLFNDYPVSYTMKTGQQYSVVDQDIQKQWLSLIKSSLLKKVNFESTEMGEVLLKDETAPKVMKIAKSIFKVVMGELLDDRGQIKPEIVNLLGLNDLLNSAISSGDLDLNAQIIRQVAQSFYGQIIIANIFAPIIDKMTADTENEKNLLEIQKLGAIQMKFNLSHLPGLYEDVVSEYRRTNFIDQKKWRVLVLELYEDVGTRSISQDFLDRINLYRHRLAREFISILKDQPSYHDQLELLNKVIKGETALGKILIKPKNRLGFFFSADEVTGSINLLMEYRNQIEKKAAKIPKRKASDEKEDKDEEKHISKSQDRRHS